MKILRHGIWCLSLGLLMGVLLGPGASLGLAQSSGVDAVLEASRAATGATENALRLVIVSDADCVGPDGEYEMRTSSAPGGNLWFRQKHPGQDPYAALLSPDGSWSLYKDGTRVELNARVWLMVRSHDFQRIALDPGSFASELSSAGEEEFEATPCSKLQGLVGDGSGIDFFFERKTGLPRGFRMDNPMDPGKPVTIVYRDWRLVDGVKLPSVVAALDGQGEFVLDFHTIYFEEVIPPEE